MIKFLWITLLILVAITFVNFVLSNFKGGWGGGDHYSSAECPHLPPREVRVVVPSDKVCPKCSSTTSLALQNMKAESLKKKQQKEGGGSSSSSSSSPANQNKKTRTSSSSSSTAVGPTTSLNANNAPRDQFRLELTGAEKVFFPPRGGSSNNQNDAGDDGGGGGGNSNVKNTYADMSEAAEDLARLLVSGQINENVDFPKLVRFFEGNQNTGSAIKPHRDAKPSLLRTFWSIKSCIEEATSRSNSNKETIPVLGVLVTNTDFGMMLNLISHVDTPVRKFVFTVNGPGVAPRLFLLAVQIALEKGMMLTVGSSKGAKVGGGGGGGAKLVGGWGVTTGNNPPGFSASNHIKLIFNADNEGVSRAWNNVMREGFMESLGGAISDNENYPVTGRTDTQIAKHIAQQKAMGVGLGAGDNAEGGGSLDVQAAEDEMSGRRGGSRGAKRKSVTDVRARASNNLNGRQKNTHNGPNSRQLLELEDSSSSSKKHDELYVVLANADVIPFPTLLAPFAADTYDRATEKVINRFAHFAFFAVTKLGLEELGLFDEVIYPAYFEDVEIHLRAVSKGLGSHKHFGLSGNNEVNKVFWHHTSPNRNHDTQIGAQIASFGKDAYIKAKWGVNPSSIRVDFQFAKPFKHPFNNDKITHTNSWIIDTKQRACIKNVKRGSRCAYNYQLTKELEIGGGSGGRKSDGD